jgi:two-component system, NarL family, sensor kinase
MGRRGAVWLAWGVLAAAVTIVALTWLLHVKNQAGNALWWPGLENAWALTGGTLLIFCFSGAVIISRRPANLVGWILVAIGLSSGLSGFLAEYGTYALVTDPGTVPAGTFALWLSRPLYGADFGLVVLLLFLFPTGRVPSRRWRPAVWATLLASLALMSQGALSPGRLGYDLRLPSNPIGLYEAEKTLNTLTDLALVVLLVLAVCGLASLRVRYRHSQGEERQQLKWFFYGAVILLVALPVGTVFAWAGNFVPLFVGFGSFTACIAIAMLRYRLYEIDQLITRTVVYGLLTAAFTVVYLAVVVGIGTLIGTRGKPNLFLSILATALIAVAFQPARDRSRRLANRLVYGKRATPYEVLSEFSRGMAGAATDDSLLRKARLVVEATGAVQATVWLRLGDVLQPQASWPPAGPSAQPIALDGRGVRKPWPRARPRADRFPSGTRRSYSGR